MVVKGLNHDLDAYFLVLKPSACQNIRSAQCPRNALLARKWHLQLKGPSTRCKATALGVPTFYSWQCPHSTFLLSRAGYREPTACFPCRAMEQKKFIGLRNGWLRQSTVFYTCRKVIFDIRLLYFTTSPYGDSAELVLPMAHAQRFYCVLHALRGCRATKLGPWECPHSTFLWCFTGCRVTKLIP